MPGFQKIAHFSGYFLYTTPAKSQKEGSNNFYTPPAQDPRFHEETSFPRRYAPRVEDIFAP